MATLTGFTFSPMAPKSGDTVTMTPQITNVPQTLTFQGSLDAGPVINGTLNFTEVITLSTDPTQKNNPGVLVVTPPAAGIKSFAVNAAGTAFTFVMA